MHTTISSSEALTLKQLTQLFSSLEPFVAQNVEGIYEAELIGPAWLKKLAQLSLPLAGLSGWYGKRLLDDGAINLCRKGRGLIDSVEMRRSEEESKIDGESVLVLSYDQNSPILLRPMRDEFRFLNPDTLLGMSIYNFPGLSGVYLPFLLKRQ